MPGAPPGEKFLSPIARRAGKPGPSLHLL